MTTHAAIINHASGVTKSELYRMSAVCVRQLRQHAAPLWAIEPPAVSFASSDAEVLDGTQLITLFDDADQAGLLGYHDLSPAGIPYTKVFVNDILRNGGHLFDGPMSISVTLSHELLEMTWDPYCNLFRTDAHGVEHAQEACDACEGDAYELSDGIWVSDFLTDDFFQKGAASDARFDFLGLIKKPFETRPGGYQIVRKGGDISQVFGADYPGWKLAGKAHPGARTARRVRA